MDGEGRATPKTQLINLEMGMGFGGKRFPEGIGQSWLQIRLGFWKEAYWEREFDRRIHSLPTLRKSAPKPLEGKALKIEGAPMGLRALRPGRGPIPGKRFGEISPKAP